MSRQLRIKAFKAIDEYTIHIQLDNDDIPHFKPITTDLTSGQDLVVKGYLNNGWVVLQPLDDKEEIKVETYPLYKTGRILYAKR